MVDSLWYTAGLDREPLKLFLKITDAGDDTLLDNLGTTVNRIIDNDIFPYKNTIPETSDLTEDLQECAKMCGIDKKHITNNIYPRESPTETHTKNKHHDYISWFDNITVKLGGGEYALNISRWYDEQIERKKLQLEFRPLVIKTANTN